MSLTLMTKQFYKALILKGEIWCWSLLWLKGLMRHETVILAFTRNFSIFVAKKDVRLVISTKWNCQPWQGTYIRWSGPFCFSLIPDIFHFILHTFSVAPLRHLFAAVFSRPLFVLSPVSWFHQVTDQSSFLVPFSPLCQAGGTLHVLQTPNLPPCVPMVTETHFISLNAHGCAR